MSKPGAPARGRDPSAPPDDAALVARLLAGDERAFASLVDGLHGSLVRIARVFVRDEAVAQEVAQETWRAVLEGLPTFEGRSSLKTWIVRILTNRAKTRGAREARFVPFSALDFDAEHEPAVDPARFKPNGMWAAARPRLSDEETPERLLGRSETMLALERAIEELPPVQRAVIVLRDVEGINAAEVCNILELTETNQRVLLHRARSKVRAALEQHMKQ
jgi:RNA polymerase sigma-70 factor (ECF subfamily)